MLNYNNAVAYKYNNIKNMDKRKIKEKNFDNNLNKYNIPIQSCPLCGKIISAMPGTRDAICGNCGFKDPCCE